MSRPVSGFTPFSLFEKTGLPVDQSTVPSAMLPTEQMHSVRRFAPAGKQGYIQVSTNQHNTERQNKKLTGFVGA